MKFSGMLWYVPVRTHYILNAYDCFQSATSSQKDLPNQLTSKQASPIPSDTLVITDSFSTNPLANTSDQHFPESDLDKDKIAWLNLAEGDDSLTQSLDVCVEQWQNAGPEARKKMFALFTVAGIFLAVCCHGHVLVICDMIQSGEL
jgi:Kyakuja-Dileera-Zisupton transposase